MKKLSIVCLFFILPVFSFSDALWNKAIQIKKANENLRFHKSYSKLLTASKKNSNVAEIWKAHKYQGEKEYVMVLKVIKNGRVKNLGAVANKWAMAKNKKKRNLSKKLNKKSFLKMFDKNQKKYKIKRTGRTKKVNNITCAEYAVIFKDKRMKGFVYLNIKSGAPVKVLFIPSGYKSSLRNSKPSYGDFEEKNRMWYLKKVVINLHIGYFGKSLNLQSTLKFSEYR